MTGTTTLATLRRALFRWLCDPEVRAVLSRSDRHVSFHFVAGPVLLRWRDGAHTGRTVTGAVRRRRPAAPRHGLTAGGGATRGERRAIGRGASSRSRPALDITPTSPIPLDDDVSRPRSRLSPGRGVDRIVSRAQRDRPVASRDPPASFTIRRACIRTIRRGFLGRDDRRCGALSGCRRDRASAA